MAVDDHRLSELVRQMPDVILGWHTDAGGVDVLSFLGAASNWLGPAPSGPGPGGLPVTDEDLPRWHSQRLRASGAAEMWSFEGHYTAHDGAIRNFALYALTPGPKGEGSGIVVDVTVRNGAVTNAVRLAQLQAQLIAREGVASLGQLTAGIIHEIKNPLNFVTNFAALSIELLDELKDYVASGSVDDIAEVIGLLTDNLAKIRDHGRRADSIMRSMLLQARGGSGQRQATDLNALVAESFALAYHGARGKDPSFNCSCGTSFDPTVGTVDVIPEDMTRVLVNLATNAFYATDARLRAAREPGYAPAVEITTRRVGAEVEVRVRDNGIGIPEHVRQKLFTAFFTTKPIGEGTGLGLSLSAEIVHRHDGTISVESAEGSYTAVIMRLPLASVEPPPTRKISPGLMQLNS